MTNRLDAEATFRWREDGTGRIGRTRQGVESISGSLTRMQRIAAATAFGGGAIEALRRSAGHAVRIYSDIQEGLVGVAKTADLSAAEVAALDRALKDLSLDASVGLARTELLEIAGAAGQLGVTGVDNLTRFTKTVALLQGATNLGGAQAATTLARLLTVTGEGVSTVGRLGSVITRLGNEFAATEAEIAATATRVAQNTAVFGVSSAQAAALGTSLRALGVEAELGGTAVGRAFRGIGQALAGDALGDAARRLTALTGRALDDLRTEFAADAAGVFRTVLTGLGALPANEMAAALADLGIEGERAAAVFGPLSRRTEVVTRAFDAANDELREQSALTEEALRASRTFSRQMALVRNDIDSQAAALGEELAPAILFVARNWDLAGVALAAAGARIAATTTRRVADAARRALAEERSAEVAARAAVVETRAAAAAAAQQRRNAALRRQGAEAVRAQTAGFVGYGAAAARARQAEADLARATAAHTTAVHAQAAAQARLATGFGRTAIAARALRGALNFFGGWVGLVTTGVSALIATLGLLRARSAEAADSIEVRVAQAIRGSKSQLDAFRELRQELKDDIRIARAERDEAYTPGSGSSIIAGIGAGLGGPDAAARAVANLQQSTQDRLAELERLEFDLGQTIARAEARERELRDLTRGGAGGGAGGTAPVPAAARTPAEAYLDALAQSRDALHDLSHVEQLRADLAAGRLGDEQKISDEVRRRLEREASDLDRIEAAIAAERARAKAEAARIRAAEEADRAHRAAAREIGDALATPYQRAAREAARWRAATLAALDETAEDYDALAARVEEVYGDRITAALEEARQRMRDETEAMLREATSARAGIIRGLQSIADEASGAAKGMEDLTRKAFRGMEDALTDFVSGGKVSFKALVNSMIRDLARLAVQQHITGPLAGALLGSFGGGAGDGNNPGTNYVGHAGGVVGSLPIQRSGVPEYVWDWAQRYHGGGRITGLRADEVPIIAQKGETIIPRGQAAGGAPPPATVIVNVENHGSTPVTATAEATVDARGIVVDVVLQDLDDGGPISRRLGR